MLIHMHIATSCMDSNYTRGRDECLAVEEYTADELCYMVMKH